MALVMPSEENASANAISMDMTRGMLTAEPLVLSSARSNRPFGSDGLVIASRHAPRGDLQRPQRPRDAKAKDGQDDDRHESEQQQQQHDRSRFMRLLGHERPGIDGDEPPIGPLDPGEGDKSTYGSSPSTESGGCCDGMKVAAFGRNISLTGRSHGDRRLR